MALYVPIAHAKRYGSEKPSAAIDDPAPREASTNTWAARKKGAHRIATPGLHWLWT
jgi:hypothetical protein